MSYTKQNKICKQTLETVQHGLEIIVNFTTVMIEYYYVLIMIFLGTNESFETSVWIYNNNFWQSFKI